MPDNFSFDITSRLSITDGASVNAPTEVQDPAVHVADPAVRQIQFEIIGYGGVDSAALQQRWQERQTWLVLHGWNANYADFVAIANGIKEAHPNDIVLTLDWRQASSTALTGLDGIDDFANFDAATWIGPVAEVVAQQLKLWGINPQSLNLVGHSLGALLASEIAFQLNQQNGQDPPDYQAAKVNTITALDPPSDNPPGRSIFDTFLRYRFGYVYPRNGQDVRPVPFNQVSNFSRSFLGRSSLAGSVEFASWANEAITVDFGLPAAANPERQHGDVYRAFQELIANDGTQLAEGLFGLNDQSKHTAFKDDAFQGNFDLILLIHLVFPRPAKSLMEF